MILTWDTETHPIDRCKLAPKIVCSQTAIDAAPPQIHLWRDAPIAEQLRNADKIVTANGAFDAAAAINERPDLIPLVIDAYEGGRIVDVLLDGKLLDIAAGQYERIQKYEDGWSLESLTARVDPSIKMDKSTWRLRFFELADVPVEFWPAGAVEYALTDPYATRVVYVAQRAAEQEWIGWGCQPLGFHSVQAARVAFGLHLASCWGVLTDEARTRQLGERVEKWIGRVKSRLQRAGLVRAGGSKDGSRNTKAAKDAMVRACAGNRRFTGGRFKQPRPALDVQLTKTGEISLNADACVLSGSRVLELYADYTSATGAGGPVSGLEDMQQGHVLPLQGRFDPLKETSRTSSSKPKPPLVGRQMQNHPRSAALTKEEELIERHPDYTKTAEYPLLVGLRECYTPRPGNIFVGADYSMAELHTVSQLCLKLFGFSKLAELLNAGMDVHYWLAAQTLGLTYEQVMADKARYDNDRQRVKPANFGYWGGMGVDKFILYSRAQFGIRFEYHEAEQVKAVWRGSFPETGPYFGYINRLLGDNSSFTYVHPITGFVRGDCGYCDGANHGFQHLAAYGAKDAIWRVTAECFRPGSPLFGWRMWNFVHDEILLEGPLTGASEAASCLKQIMESEFNKYVPDVPTKAEPFVTPIWSKKAKSKLTDGKWSTWAPVLREAA